MIIHNKTLGCSLAKLWAWTGKLMLLCCHVLICYSYCLINGYWWRLMVLLSDLYWRWHWINLWVSSYSKIMRILILYIKSVVKFSRMLTIKSLYILCWVFFRIGFSLFGRRKMYVATFFWDFVFLHENATQNTLS